jgi:hypothetical protein
VAEREETSRTVTWQLCDTASDGTHWGWQPDKTEAAARRRLDRARSEARSYPERLHVHRLETVTTSELLDW